jgi:hypothetical protein
MDLSTERPTPNTSDKVANAEAAALDVIYTLAKQVADRGGCLTASDIAKAEPPMQAWIDAAG